MRRSTFYVYMADDNQTKAIDIYSNLLCQPFICPMIWLECVARKQIQADIVYLLAFLSSLRFNFDSFDKITVLQKNKHQNYIFSAKLKFINKFDSTALTAAFYKSSASTFPFTNIMNYALCTE